MEDVIFVENATNVIIEGFDIEGEGLGITNPKSYAVIYEESSGTIRDCDVSPNTIGDLQGVGIGAWDTSSLTVDTCTIQNFGRIGVFYFSGCSGGVYNSTIIGQVYGGEGDVNYGIEVEAYDFACDIGIIGNGIYNCSNTFSPEPTWSSAGVVIDGWRAFYDLPPSTVVIEENDIYDNYYGIEVVANSYSYAHYNNIYNNREYGVIQDSDYAGSNVTFDARFNWWGDASGPTHASNVGGVGDTISDYVDYSPWLSDIFETTPRTYHVNPTGTIQEAINEASSGDTIIVHAGTYNETLRFSSTTAGGLSVIGEDKSSTSITGGIRFEASNYNGLIIRNFTITGDGRQRPSLSQATVGTSAAANLVSNVEFSNCIFDGENIANRMGLYIHSIGGAFIFDNNEIKNYTGWGTVELNEVGRIVSSYIFTNNYVHDNDGSCALRGNPTDWTDQVTATGNTFNNNGGGDSWASLEVNNAENIIVRYNNITNTQAGSWGEGEALQFWNFTSLTVEYNNISNNYEGIYFAGPAPWAGDVSGAHINYNNIYGNTQYGVKVETGNTGTVDASYNWWGDPWGPTASPPAGDKVIGNVDFEPWLLEPYPPATPVETLLYIDPAKIEYWTPSYDRVFQVDVKIENVTELTCYEFKLYWNTTLLNFDYAYKVEIWPLQIEFEYIDEPLGRYWLAVSARGEENFTGSTTLVELYFKIKYDPIYPNNAYSLLNLNETVLGDTSEPTPQPIVHMVHDAEYWCYSTKPKMKVEPPTSTAKKLGKTFDINITVQDVVNLYEFDFSLYYNTTLLDAQDVVLGPFLEEPTTVIVVTINDAYNSTHGLVRFAAKSLSPAPSANGTGVLATIMFKVTNTSIWPEPDLECALSLDSTKLKTIGGIEVPHDKIDGLYSYKPVIGDLNSDGTVDLDDLYIIALAFGSKPGDLNWNKYADLTRDDVINVLDLRTAARHFGEDC